MHADLLAAISLGEGIGGLDWGIIIAFLAISTLFAFVMKGRQAGARDFFLSGRNLPWVVVCVSLVATEISAAGFVGVPYSVFSEDLSYLQLAIGAILARFLIAYYFLPAFMEKETYSPYHFVGRKLGLGAERMTSVLFMIGAVLGQGVRVLTIAVALHIITGIDVSLSILTITAFAALWAVIGGIRTVVWTDLIQLVVLVAAAVAAGVYLISQTAGGLPHVIDVASAAEKLRVFDFRADKVLEFTIWTALFGSTFNTLASHGTDQMNTQRLFCCRSTGDAKKAILWSSLSQGIVLLFLCIGLGLFAYYRQHADELRQYTMDMSEKELLAIFIATALPVGLKGLLVAGLLAAAISSLNSALAALSQTTVRSFFINVAKPVHDEKSQVHLARVFTVLWGIVLYMTASYFESMQIFSNLLTAALKATSFTYGALLGALLLAFLPHGRDGRGLLFSTPLAVLTAFGMSVHEAWTHWIMIVGVAVLFVCWCYMLFREVEDLAHIKDQNQYVRRAWYIMLAEFPRTVWVLAGSALVLYMHFGDFYGYFADASGQIAWPWFLPVGIGITVVLGYLLSRPRAMVTTEDGVD
ncbi:MAG: hypothetical protein GY842_03245 [bacterium]|nr:hypothetical protein [bacterium]